MDPLFRLKLDYISRIPMLTVEEFRNLSPGELEARPNELSIPVFGKKREITFCQGIPGIPDIPLTVQEFSSVEGDVVHKTWTRKDGEVKRVPLLPFAIADPKATSVEYQAFLSENWIAWARATDEDQYRLMAQLYQSQQTTRQGKELFGSFGPFALAYTLKMGSAWISSPGTLGMEPVYEEGYPLHGRVALPSVAKAQFDALSSLLMATLQREIERSLEALEAAADWQVFFVTLTVLGELVSRMRTDRARHAKQRGVEALFTEPEAVEMAEAGLNKLIALFHRFQRRFDEVKLLEESLLEVQRCYHNIRQMDNTVEFSTGWWLRQLIEQPTEWKPRPTYRAN